MKSKSDLTELPTLDAWDFPDYKLVPDGYDQKRIPEATPENMAILMNKINELTEAVNTLMFINSYDRRI